MGRASLSHGGTVPYRLEKEARRYARRLRGRWILKETSARSWSRRTGRVHMKMPQVWYQQAHPQPFLHFQQALNTELCVIGRSLVTGHSASRIVVVNSGSKLL